jgi:hypothetical protein
VVGSRGTSPSCTKVAMIGMARMIAIPASIAAMAEKNWNGLSER